jgi:hypothetical protein
MFTAIVPEKRPAISGTSYATPCIYSRIWVLYLTYKYFFGLDNSQMNINSSLLVDHLEFRRMEDYKLGTTFHGYCNTAEYLAITC